MLQLAGQVNYNISLARVSSRDHGDFKKLVALLRIRFTGCDSYYVYKSKLDNSFSVAISNFLALSHELERLKVAVSLSLTTM